MSSASATTSSRSIKFMTYNVWSCEHVAVYRRIRAICEIIERHDPDVIFLQEVTDYIHCLFLEAPWWENYAEFSSKEKEYHGYTSASKPFCLLLSKLHYAKVALAVSPHHTPSSPKWPPSPPRPREPDAPSDLLSAWEARCWYRLGAATCSLAGPTPSDTGSVRRRARASAFLEYFDAVHQFDVAVHHREHGTGSDVLDEESVVLGGGLRWDDDLDGPLRLGGGGDGDGWVDAWLELRGGGCGWTYDAVANPMVRGLKNLAKERRRPDRFVCKLKDFKLDSIQMLGMEAIPSVTRFDDDDNVVPVLPSHHFGLLLTISPKDN